MAASKRFTTEQIVAKLQRRRSFRRRVRRCRRCVSGWGSASRRSTGGGIRYGALKEDEAQRLKALEAENARLKRIVAEQALDISMLKDLNRGNW